MAFQRDYVLRIIEMMGEFFRKIGERMDRREQLLALDEMCRDQCGLSLKAAFALKEETVQDLLPEKLRMRKKSPYPKTCSAAYTSMIKGKVRALCADTNAPIWSIVDSCAIEKLAASKLDPADLPWFGQLMAGPQMLAYILQVNTWLTERNIAIEL